MYALLEHERGFGECHLFGPINFRQRQLINMILTKKYWFLNTEQNCICKYLQCWQHIGRVFAGRLGICNIVKVICKHCKYLQNICNLRKCLWAGLYNRINQKQLLDDWLMLYYNLVHVNTMYVHTYNRINQSSIKIN